MITFMQTAKSAFPSHDSMLFAFLFLCYQYFLFIYCIYLDTAEVKTLWRRLQNVTETASVKQDLLIPQHIVELYL